MTVVQEWALAEAVGLASIVAEFAGMVTADGAPSDPAVERLSPVVYPDDAEASADFRAVTRPDLLGRRAADAARVLRSLDAVGAAPGRPLDDDALRPVLLELTADEAGAWLRTLAAVRLVLASRLGIEDAADAEAADPGDPRVAVYEWLGARLEGLVGAVAG